MNILKRAALLAPCLLLASCASLFGPRDVEIPLSRMQERIDQRFPVTHRVIKVFDVTLSRPRLGLDAGRARVALATDTEVRTMLSSEAWNGALAVSGGIGIDNATNTVRLRSASVDEFRLDGISTEAQRYIARLSSALLTKVYSDIPVYTFRPEDLRRAGVQFRPTRVRIVDDAIVVTLEPVR